MECGQRMHVRFGPAMKNRRSPHRLKPKPYAWALKQLRIAQAHKITRGRGELVVAVIDLGYSHHPGLEGHLWTNPNAREDSVHGWNFVNDDASLLYAGIRAETSDYLRGHHAFVTGEVTHMAPMCPIMIVRVGGGNPDSWWRGIRYAVDHGARVLVMPHGYIGGERANGTALFYQGTDFGYPGDNPELRAAMDYAYDHGCLFFKGSADNRGRRVATFLAGFAPVFAVGSSNRKARPADICAHCDYVEAGTPAGERFSGLESDQILGYGGDENLIRLTGGCMSAGFAGGVGALVWSRFPHLTNEQLRQVLRNTARKIAGEDYNADGWEPKLGCGILDAFRAVSLQERQLCRDLRLLPSTVKIVRKKKRIWIEATIRNHGVFDAEKAMVVAYNGDPQKPADPKASREHAAELQTRQIGHTISFVRGLHRKVVSIELVAKPGGAIWFETFSLDRQDEGRVHRTRAII